MNSVKKKKQEIFPPSGVVKIKLEYFGILKKTPTKKVLQPATFQANDFLVNAS